MSMLLFASTLPPLVFTRCDVCLRETTTTFLVSIPSQKKLPELASFRDIALHLYCLPALRYLGDIVCFFYSTRHLVRIWSLISSWSVPVCGVNVCFSPIFSSKPNTHLFASPSSLFVCLSPMTNHPADISPYISKIFFFVLAITYLLHHIVCLYSYVSLV